MKAHLGFGGMNIHIDKMRFAIEEEHYGRVAVCWQIIGIGGAHRSIQHFVAYGTAINEKILRLRIGTVECGQAGKTRQANVFSRSIDLKGI